MPPVSLIVLKLGAEDLLDRIVDMLRRRGDVDLATVAPIAFDDAPAVLKAKRDLDVLLIIGPQAEIGEATEFVRDLHPDLLVVTVAMESGRTNLTLPDPNFDELGEAIVALGRARKRAIRWGKILNFGTWLLRREEEPRPRMPSVLEGEVARANVRILAEALDWVEKATKILLDTWTTRTEDVPGFATSWETLERWLANFEKLASVPAEPAERAFGTLERSLSGEDGQATPLGAVAKALRGDPLALKLFLITVAGELDMRFHRLFGALHDDFSRRRPSLGLASAIVAGATRGATPLDIRAEIAVLERLRRLGFVLAGAGCNAADEPLVARMEVVDWLLGGDVQQLVGAAAPLLGHTLSAEAIDLIPADRVRRLRRLVRHKLALPDGRGIGAVLLGGSEPGWLAVEAAAIDTAPLLAGAPKRDVAPSDIEHALTQVAVAANLTRRRLCLDLSGAGADGGPVWPLLEAMLDRFEQPPFVVVDNPAQLLLSVRRERLAIVDFPAPSQGDRRQAIAAIIAAHGNDEAGLATALADRFPVAPNTLPRAVTLAFAAANEKGRPLVPTQEDWYAGFRRAAGARLPQLARRVEPEAAQNGAAPLDRVILPKTPREQLEELVRHVRFGTRVLDDWGFAKMLDGKGVAALFSGESGTGKTTAAHAIASALESDLYVIELSQVVSKYIGETEKNLEIVFAEAQAAGAVLLFDEADALFGKRSAVTSAHDRYANIEVAYLLQRLQRFTGLAILTTNNAANIDPAFVRRLRFRIEFPRPAPAERLRIWEQSLPSRLREGAFDLKRLAIALDVTGGTIRQMAFHAAINAAADQNRPIEWDDVCAGARSQLVRLGLHADLAKLDAIPAPARQRVA